MHRYLETGAGLTTDTRGVPLSEGVEDRVGLGLGVDTLAQLQILFGGEGRDLVDVLNDGIEGVAEEEQGGFERLQLLGDDFAVLGESDQILGERLRDIERCGDALAGFDVLLGGDGELVGVGKRKGGLALVVPLDSLVAGASQVEEFAEVGPLSLGEVVSGTEIVQLPLAAGLGEAGAGQLLVDLIVEPRNELLLTDAAVADLPEPINNAGLVVLVLIHPFLDEGGRVVLDHLVDGRDIVGLLGYFQIVGGDGCNCRRDGGRDSIGGGGPGVGTAVALALFVGRRRRSTGRLPRRATGLGRRGGTATVPPLGVALLRSARSGRGRLLLLGVGSTGGLGGCLPRGTGLGSGGRGLGALLLGRRHGGGILSIGCYYRLD